MLVVSVTLKLSFSSCWGRSEHQRPAHSRMIRNIVQDNEPLLRAQSSPLCLENWAQYDSVWIDMFDTLRQVMSGYRFSRSAGISAIQIGVPLRMCVIWTPSIDFYTIANPVIEEESEDFTSEFEGCLSFFHLRGRMKRPRRIMLSHRDRSGTLRRIQLENWEARIALHEIDHMDGVLYSDRLAPGDTLISRDAYLSQLSCPPPIRSIDSSGGT